MKKTKIICTIGPATSTKDIIRKLILSGMNVARINMSHSNHKDAEDIIKTIRELNKELRTSVGILVDTRGPEIRIKTYNGESIQIGKGDQVILTTDNNMHNNGKLIIDCPAIIDDVRKGNLILLGDGTIELKIVENALNEITCEALNDGTIKNRMKANIPGVHLSIDFLSPGDKADITFASQMDADFIALSFVRSSNDVLDVNDILINLRNEHMQIIAKIENASAIEDIDSIIKVSDGIMVARGDLGVEIDLEKVPAIQKRIVKKAYLSNKLCIVATQMLASMESEPRPTRAEVSDVANAVIDGTDAVMLSGETAMGEYPIETVEMMHKIIDNIEKELDYNKVLTEREINFKEDIPTVIAHNVVESANKLKAKAIVASTMSGYTAKLVSNFRPSCPIIATTPNEDVARSLALNWGIIPVVVDLYDSTDQIVSNAIRVAKRMIPLDNDKIIITGSFPATGKKDTNFMKIENIE